MKRFLILALILSAVVHAEFDKVGTTTAQFLKMGVGARAKAMGGSFVALSDDGTAHYWNPAGMVVAQGISTTFSHTDWALDITHEFVSVTVPRGPVGVFGLSISALTMDEKEVTTVIEQDGSGLYYSVMDMALAASYARRMSDRLAYGVTLKYIHLAAYNEIAQTFAIDIGSILQTDFYGMKIGMALSNFGGEPRYSGRDLLQKADVEKDVEGNVLTEAELKTEPWPLPLMIRIGVAMDVLGQEEAILSRSAHRLTLTLDAEHPNDAPEHLNFGLEFAFRELFYLRGGYRLNYDLDKFSVGAGFRLPLANLTTTIDYAVMPFGPFGTTAFISIGVFLK
ncbi:MAG: PorV/PorQ family protein [Fidelibacterota bacterium]